MRVRFLLTETILPPQIHTVIFGGSHLQPTLEWGLVLHLLGKGYLHKLFGIFLHGRFVSFPAFIYSIIHNMNSWVFIFSLWVILQHGVSRAVAQIGLPLVLGTLSVTPGSLRQYH